MACFRATVQTELGATVNREADFEKGLGGKEGTWDIRPPFEALKGLEQMGRATSALQVLRCFFCGEKIGHGTKELPEKNKKWVK